MALPGHQPWTSAEKNYLLAEIIKQHAPPPSVLLKVVYNLGIQIPNWNETALPPGRPLNACQQAFNEMRRTPLSMLGGAIGPQTPSPLSAYPPGAMRSVALEGSASFPGSREIRPKPTTSTGAYSQPSPIEQPLNKKKRGRPRKDDTQPRSEMAAAPGEANMPPGPQPAGPSMMGLQAQPSLFTEPPLLEQPPAEELRPLPPVSRMPISSILTPTIQQSTSQSGSSSGKRKRGRSTRSEPEDYPAAGPSGAGQAQTYESPYSRLTIETQDSPARAAVLRHREEHDTRPPSRDPQQRSAQAPTTVTAGPDPEMT